MKQGQFEQLYQGIWTQLEAQIKTLEASHSNRSATDRSATNRSSAQNETKLNEFASDYRKICYFHALAQERHYSSYLVDKLGHLVVRGHQQLYSRKQPFLQNLISFVVADFPCLVRSEKYFLAWATVFFCLPCILIFLAILWQPDVVYTVTSPAQVSQFEDMYDPTHRVLGSARESSTNIEMFGFYISNNIGVSFRTFASGILFGIGSLFFLIYNGLLMGGIAGHLTNVGFTNTFFPFVIGHCSFELTAIVISGAAGLKLGYSLLAPGNLTRLESLKGASKIAIRLMYGVIIMLLIAAFIEAFWSSNNILMPWQKYLVGSFLWLLVVSYFCFSGRSSSHQTSHQKSHQANP